MTETNASSQRALSLVSQFPASQPQSLDFARSLAIVVGINDYRHVPQLRTTVPDAEELARPLRDEYGYAVALLHHNKHCLYIFTE